MDRCGEAASPVGRYDGDDLADHVPGRLAPAGPVADGTHQAVRPGGELGAGADLRRNRTCREDPAWRLEALPAVGGAGEVQGGGGPRVAGTPHDVDGARRRGTALTGGQPGVVTVAVRQHGHRRREGVAAVVGPPDEDGAAALVGGGADVAATLRVERDGHVV